MHSICYEAGAYYEAGYIVLAAKAVANAAARIATWTRVGYGSYAWKARIVNPGANKTFFVGFGERGPAYGIDGIFLKNDAGTYKFETVKNEAVTSTTLAGQDWTVERTFKIEWTATSVKLYVDGALVATHTTNIPNVNLVRFVEILHAATAPANRSEIYARAFGEAGI